VRRRRIYVTWLALHLLLIVSISCRDTLRSIAEGPTIFPPWFRRFSQKAARTFSTVVGQRFSASKPIREALVAYVDLAGIEAGYGYFAPNVPGTYKISFQLNYPDGRVEYALPKVSSAAAGLRIAALIDEIGRTKSDELKEILVKMLAQSMWRDHPAVKTIRAELALLTLPTLNEFEHGKRNSYQVLYTYDFSRAGEHDEAQTR
jgi:hypothetical protein